MKTLLSLYENPEITWDAQAWEDNFHHLDAHLHAVQSIGNIAAPEELADRLDKLSPTSSERQPAAALLGSIHGPVLLHTFGEAVMAWTMGNDMVPERSHKLAQQLEDEGYNPAFLRWARDISRGPKGKEAPKSTDVLAQNRVMEGIAGAALQHVDLGASLQASRAESVGPLSDKRVNSYALIPLQIGEGHPFLRARVREWEGRETHEKDGRVFPMYIDRPVGFALTYKGIPQMTVCATAKGADTLQINQLQGVLGERWKGDQLLGTIGARGLAPLDWRKLGVHVTAQLAENVGMSSVGIIPSKSARIAGWSSISPADAKKAYDDIADQLWFERAEDRSWVRSTTDILQD